MKIAYFSILGRGAESGHQADRQGRSEDVGLMIPKFIRAKNDTSRTRRATRNLDPTSNSPHRALLKEYHDAYLLLEYNGTIGVWKFRPNWAVSAEIPILKYRAISPIAIGRNFGRNFRPISSRYRYRSLTGTVETVDNLRCEDRSYESGASSGQALLHNHCKAQYRGQFLMR